MEQQYNLRLEKYRDLEIHFWEHEADKRPITTIEDVYRYIARATDDSIEVVKEVLNS